MHRPIRAIAVDYAGTLTTAQRRRPDGALIRRQLAGLGVPADEKFATLIDLSLWRYYVESLPDSLPRLLRDAAKRCAIDLPDMDLLIAAIWDACGDHPVDPAAAAAVLAQHQAGRIVLLASNTNRPGRYRQRTLIDAGLSCMRPVCSSDIGAAKPNPDFYARVIDEAGVAPEEILFIGDSLQNDVAGPINSGMRAAWIDLKRPRGLAPARMADGTPVLSHLSQLDPADP